MVHLLSQEGYLMRKRRGHYVQEQREEDEKLLTRTTQFFNNLLMQDFDSNLFLYAMVLFNKAVMLSQKKRTPLLGLNGGGSLKLYSVCFLIAFKMLEETFKIFLEDMEILSGYSKEEIKDLELRLLTDIFDFQTVVKEREIKMAQRWLMNVYQCNQHLVWN